MPRADTDALARLAPVLRQLRDIKGVREERPGIFHVRREAFVHFHEDADGLYAELKKPGGSGFERYPLATPAQQRKLVEDARLRAARLDDE